MYFKDLTSSNGPKQSEERFDQLFKGDDKTGEHDDSDTSHILSDDNPQSKKLDTWADSDSEEDSDDIQDFKKKINHLDNVNAGGGGGGQLQQKSAGVEPHYDTLFDNLAANKSAHDDEVVGM